MRLCGRGSDGRVRRGDFGARQRHIERRAFTGTGVRPDSPAVPRHDAMDVGEPDAGTFELRRGMQSLKDAEEFRRVLHVESDTVVANIERENIVQGDRPDLDVCVRPAGLTETTMFPGVAPAAGETESHVPPVTVAAVAVKPAAPPLASATLMVCAAGFAPPTWKLIGVSPVGLTAIAVVFEMVSDTGTVTWLEEPGDEIVICP